MPGELAAGLKLTIPLPPTTISSLFPSPYPRPPVRPRPAHPYNTGGAPSHGAPRRHLCHRNNRSTPIAPTPGAAPGPKHPRARPSPASTPSNMASSPATPFCPTSPPRTSSSSSPPSTTSSIPPPPRSRSWSTRSLPPTGASAASSASKTASSTTASGPFATLRTTTKKKPPPAASTATPPTCSASPSCATLTAPAPSLRCAVTKRRSAAPSTAPSNASITSGRAGRRRPPTRVPPVG